MSWWSKHITKNVSKVVRAITGNTKSPSTTTDNTPTPAAQVAAPMVSAPITESAATTSTVQSAAQVQNVGAKGKRKLTINANGISGTGVNF